MTADPHTKSILGIFLSETHDVMDERPDLFDEALRGMLKDIATVVVDRLATFMGTHDLQIIGPSLAELEGREAAGE